MCPRPCGHALTGSSRSDGRADTKSAPAFREAGTARRHARTGEAGCRGWRGTARSAPAIFRHDSPSPRHRCIFRDARIAVPNTPSLTTGSYIMARSLITLTGSSQRWQSLWRPMRALYLARPDLITRLLAIVAFFSIGIV